MHAILFLPSDGRKNIEFMYALIRKNVGKNVFPTSNVGFSKIEVLNKSKKKYFLHFKRTFMQNPHLVSYV